MSADDSNQPTQKAAKTFQLIKERHWDGLSRLARLTIMMVAFVFVGVTATFVINAAELRQEETVVLDNGKEVRLGDSVADLDVNIAPQALVTADKKIYQYPIPDDNQLIEVLIYTDTKKVVAIQIISDDDNRLKKGNGLVGESRQELLAQVTARTRGAEARIQSIRDGLSYKIRSNRSGAHTYYLFDKCIDANIIESVALAYPEGEKYFRPHDVPDCEVEFD